jgi:hypothetical protein
MAGVKQNKSSHVGEDNKMPGNAASPSIEKMEGFVGSPGCHKTGSGAVRFNMPESVTDHSRVRESIGKE